MVHWDFPGGPVLRSLASSAGDLGLMHGRGTQIPHATGHQSLCTVTSEPALESPGAATAEPMCPRACGSVTGRPSVLQLERACTPQRRASACCNKDPAQPNKYMLENERLTTKHRK